MRKILKDPAFFCMGEKHMKNWLSVEWVIRGERIHYLENLLAKRNAKLARLHRKMRMSALEFNFKSSLRLPKKCN
jgi:hypothetical protein